MKRITLFLAAVILITSCTSKKKLAYLGPLPPSGGMENFQMEVPDYRLKIRDVLYITIKAMGPDGKIEDYLSSGSSIQMNTSQGEGMGLYGYDINAEGLINLPAIGPVKVEGLTLVETKNALQIAADKVFRSATVECKLLSFKYTVIGEVKSPGTYANYNNYLTLLEAIGRAGGITDLGNRDRVLVIRPYDKGTKTYRVNLQDNKLFSSDVYTLLPNDVIIVEPSRQKILFLNMPTFTSIFAMITAVLLFLNYIKQ